MKRNKEKTFPFSNEQLEYFIKEIFRAGSFHDLMIEKQAIGYEFGQQFDIIYSDIEEYKRKYLTGVYEPLREFYETDMPRIFWEKLNDAV